MNRYSKDRILKRLRERHPERRESGPKTFAYFAILFLGIVILLAVAIFALGLFYP